MMVSLKERRAVLSKESQNQDAKNPWFLGYQRSPSKQGSYGMVQEGNQLLPISSRNLKITFNTGSETFTTAD